MKTKILFSVVAFTLMVSASGQKFSIDLTFTAIDNTAYVQLDSIKVMNRTQGDSAKLYWPDTTLTYEITQGDLLLYIGYSTGFPVGVYEITMDMKQFHLFQNYPNPVQDQSMISMYIPEKGIVNVMVTDMQGRVVLVTDWQLDKGIHSFRFTPGSGNLFFLTARWNGINRSIKILSTEPSTGKRCMLNYTGSNDGNPSLKASSLKAGLVMQESGILDSPTTNETYTFQFATNIPCPETPTVTYEGQVYTTIQIFSQCWLKENLNVGIMINGSQYQTNNSIKEKYCYDNNPDSCTKYGGLYQWGEMMQYTTQQGVQGICPPGWHLPTDEEWKVLEGAADSQYGIGDPEWDDSGDRGLDAGLNLKSISGWYSGGNGTDLFGFSGLPGGSRVLNGIFYLIGSYGYWWSSSEDNYYLAWGRSFYYFYAPEVFRGNYDEGSGFSVRCLRDY